MTTPPSTLRFAQSPTEHQRLTVQASQCPKWHLTARQACDLEMLSCGGFHPLDSFVNEANYAHILDEMRLLSGDLWPLPVVLDVSEQFAKTLGEEPLVALQNHENLTLALLKVDDLWTPNLAHEAECVYGTQDASHAGVRRLLHATYPVYLGGTLTVLNSARHTTHANLRQTPEETRQGFREKQWKTVVAFQTRNPLHRAHAKMLTVAADHADGLLLHPTTAPAMPGDIDIHTRVRCYTHLLRHLPAKTQLALVPLAMRMAGPREAIWHGLIRKNYGCTHLVIGRDHAGPGASPTGEPFYAADAAISLYKKYEQEIGVQAVSFEHLVYDLSERDYVPLSRCAPKNKRTISGSELRKLLAQGQTIPEWFTYPEVADELRKAYPPLVKRGFTIFFTGLSGAGKSTLANALVAYLLARDERRVSLLDGDEVRSHLSSELGFSREHRSLNVRRIGFVASLLTKTGGIAICAPIAPYEKDRRRNRESISEHGGYIEVYVNTPAAVCQQRDTKGHYDRAQKDKTFHLTGLNDPYEEPTRPEITIDTSSSSVNACVEVILNKIRELGYIE